MGYRVYTRRLPRPVKAAGHRALDFIDVALHSSRAGNVPPAERFFLPAGYRSWKTPRYYDANAPEATVVSQPDVYAAAEALSRLLRSGTVIDLGCGKGGKLAALTGVERIVGLDIGSNLDVCRQKYPWGTWIDADLEAVGELPINPAISCGAIVVSADVVEHLVRPTQLLALIRRLLASADAAVVSTPDRRRTRGARHLGPPPNRTHIREWDIGEFARLLRAADLRVVHVGYTRTNTVDTVGRTSIAVCAGESLTPESADAVAATVRRVTRSP